VVTPGNYDGVHLGHRALLRAAREIADGANHFLQVTTLTFDPHPLQFLAPERAPTLLTAPERRRALLLGAGADRVEVASFDASFAAQTPEQFVNDVLLGQLEARAVVVGHDFRFGAKRAGDVTLLKQLVAPFGVQVVALDPVMLEGQVVSSSQVRAALGRGDVELAARMLTRVHDLERRVVAGAQRGRTIGFPTANLELTGLMAPADGVYAVAARILDDAGPVTPVLGGVANLGNRPTFAAGRSLEVHLFDFGGDLYGKTLRVGFITCLRSEQNFPSLDALRAQIGRDVEAGKAAIERCDPSLLAWL
jgi:riboflavin kinase/FMN adenylyltransferase